MLNIDKYENSGSGSEITLQEIIQQPVLWDKTLEIYKSKREELEEFIQGIDRKGKPLRVIFTGAGTSEYVGNTVCDYLESGEDISFESIGTTDLVSCPKLYFKEEVPTLLVSFARSGNSPESLAAVELGEQLVKDFYNLAITCAKDGKLAVQLGEEENSFVLNMPEESNDKGFAMTSSFTCMLLSAILVFGKDSLEEKEEAVGKIIDLANEIIEREQEITQLTDFDFDRIVYLGSGSLYKLTNECRLKILELTAGLVVTCNESSMGFRHGPKSFVNENTFIVSLVSSDPYTRQYDMDMLEEVHLDGISKKNLSLSQGEIEGEWEKFQLEDKGLEDIYLAFPYVMVAQMISLITSIRVGNTPDTPSKTGTVNRVVKGVTIHSL
ncbi:MAG: SIS domain-containing protein [Gallicola sp.]|nr:SIS domain-containing protein [Gallicola sp.]